MKPLIRVVVAAAAVAASFSAVAQSNGPVTRGEVKAQLVQLERAGYNPTNNDPTYPRNVQAAITRADDSEGGVGDGSYAFGSRTRLNAAVPAAPVSGPDSAYFGQ